MNIHGSKLESTTEGLASSHPSLVESTVIRGMDAIEMDLLDLDLGPNVVQPGHYYRSSMMMAYQPTNTLPTGGVDLLADDADLALTQTQSGALSGLGDIFGASPQSAPYVAPREVWLSAVKGKGLEISGTFSRKGNILYMDLTLTNQAMSPMNDFALQFNKNSFGLIPGQHLPVTVLPPHQSIPVNLPLQTTGPVQRMDPINNLQIAVKNNVGVFYFCVQVPLSALFVEDGEVSKEVYLGTWRDIPAQNEQQFEISSVHASADAVSEKLTTNHIFTTARRSNEGTDSLYVAAKLTNGVLILSELKLQSGNPNAMLSMKCRASEVLPAAHEAFSAILHSA